MRIVQALLPGARLSVSACEVQDDRYLEVTSLLDPGQQFLLPLSTLEPLLGLTLTTVISRWSSLTWALAWGSGTVPTATRIRYSSDGLRFRTTSEAVPQQLTADCWIAEASGGYEVATLSVHGVDVATTTPSKGW